MLFRSFHNIKIEDGAQVTFTAAVLNINELDIGSSGGNAGTGPTRVKFSVDCIVKVKNKVDVDENCQVNSTSKKVVFYVDGGNFKVESKNTWVIASIFNPLNTIKVEDDDGQPGYMIGRFIADYIDGHSKNVTWNSYDCAIPPPPPPVAAIVSTDTEQEAIAKIEVKAYPNPAAYYFNLKIKTQKKDEVMIRVIDLKGNIVEQMKGMPEQIYRFGANVVAGTYIVEVIQGSEKVTARVVKL